MGVEGKRISEVKVKGKPKAFTAEDAEDREGKAKSNDGDRESVSMCSKKGSVEGMFRPKCTFRR
jgi:hypothetical protein